MFLHFPLGLIYAAALIQTLAVPYMKLASHWQLQGFSAALKAISPSIANQVGADIWIPAAGLLLAVGIGLVLSALTLFLVGGVVEATQKALTAVRALSRGQF